MMDIRTKLMTVRVLHSKLCEMEPPALVTRAIIGWLREMEQQIRNNQTVGFAEDVAVADDAQVDLVNVRGPKQ